MTINEKKETVYQMIEYSVLSNPTVFKNGKKTLESFSCPEILASPQHTIFSVINFFLTETQKGKTEKEVIEELKEKQQIRSPEKCKLLTDYIQQLLEEEYGNEICGYLSPFINNFFDIVAKNKKGKGE